VQNYNNDDTLHEIITDRSDAMTVGTVKNEGGEEEEEDEYGEEEEEEGEKEAEEYGEGEEEEDVKEKEEDPVAPADDGTAKKKGKRKAVATGKGGGSRGVTSKTLEDQCLCDSWKVVSMDPITGTNQPSSAYWKRIEIEFDECQYTDKEQDEHESHTTCDCA
jgi:hypothetical protein